MTNVYAWPCIGAVGREWTVHDPISVSRSAITGAETITSAQRRRRLAELRISALSAGRQGAGYVEALKRLLRGGVHAVRLYSLPINHRDVVGIAPPIPSGFTWTSGGVPMGWRTGGASFVWVTGAYYTASPYPLTLLSPLQGLGRARVTGLPASQDIARVGTFLTVFSPTAPTFETRMVLRPVRSSSAGVANVWTDEPFTAAGNAEFNARDTGVFRPLSIPRALKPRSGDWEYAWSFREMFEDEAPGGFTEIDPWGSQG